jgi:DNA polymerase III gamma/tau subunit
VRDALSLLDQLRSLPKITLEDVKERTGDTGHQFVEQIVAALAAHDQKELLVIVQKMESAGISLESVVRALLNEVRGWMHQAIEKKESIEPLTRALDILLEGLRDMRSAPVPGLILEAMLLTLATVDEEPVEAKATFSRKPSAPAVSSAPKEKPAATAAAAPAPEKPAESAVIEAPELSIGSVRDHWQNVLKEISPASIKMSLKNGHVRTVEAGKVTIAFSSAFHRDKVAKTEAARIVEQTLENIFKRQMRIECILDEEQKGPTGPDKDMVNLAEAAAEVF